MSGAALLDAVAASGALAGVYTDPAVHAPALKTSREHGRRIAQEVGAFWYDER